MLCLPRFHPRYMPAYTIPIQKASFNKRCLTITVPLTHKFTLAREFHTSCEQVASWRTIIACEESLAVIIIGTARRSQITRSHNTFTARVTRTSCTNGNDIYQLHESDLPFSCTFFFTCFAQLSVKTWC